MAGRRAELDNVRLLDLSEQIAETYNSTRPRRFALNPATAIVLVAVVALVLGLAGAFFAMHRAGRETTARTPRNPPVHRSRLLAAVPAYRLPPSSPAPAPTPSPSPSPVPTDTPTPSPTPSATASPTATPSARPHAKRPAKPRREIAQSGVAWPEQTDPPDMAADDSPTLNSSQAPAVVHGEGPMRVGGKGGCPSQNVTVTVAGEPPGCTLYGSASSGVLANGHGIAMVVPVAAADDPSNVLYGLLYVQQVRDTVPLFVGVLAGDGTGHLTVRVQNGVLLERNGSHTRYSTFDGRSVVVLGN
ncbi:MAG TPA: hypothetical protein VMF61_15950 [Candidatus Acidoferrales bacterium]|nr:hypothetical protein [Candidatus Acidoferrales bacterium]